MREQDFTVVTQGKRFTADFKCDMSVTKEVHDMLQQAQPDVVVNLVALSNVDACEEQINQAYLQNVKPVENLASWMKNNSKCRLIHISTDQVYDGEKLHVESEVTLTNNYAFSKYAGELAALCVDSVVLRTNFFGKSIISHRKSFSDWLTESFQEQRPLSLFTDVYFSPLNMVTLNKMIAVVIRNWHSGIYNLGSLEGMSKRDFAHTLANHLQLDTSCAQDSSCEDVNLKAYRPRNMCMDSNKFATTFSVELPTLRQEICSLERPTS